MVSPNPKVCQYLPAFVQCCPVFPAVIYFCAISNGGEILLCSGFELRNKPQNIPFMAASFTIPTVLWDVPRLSCAVNAGPCPPPQCHLAPRNKKRMKNGHIQNKQGPQNIAAPALTQKGNTFAVQLTQTGFSLRTQRLSHERPACARHLQGRATHSTAKLSLLHLPHQLGAYFPGTSWRLEKSRRESEGAAQSPQMDPVPGAAAGTL